MEITFFTPSTHHSLTLDFVAALVAAGLEYFSNVSSSSSPCELSCDELLKSSIMLKSTIFFTFTLRGFLHEHLQVHPYAKVMGHFFGSQISTIYVFNI